MAFGTIPDGIHFDVGCGNLPGGNLTMTTGNDSSANPSPAQWAAAASGYLQWAAAHHAGPYRDGSGWRMIPVRVTSSAKGEVILSQPKIVIGMKQ